MARKTQNGWTTQPPVGDKNGSFGTVFRARQLNDAILRHDAHQGFQTLVGDAEGKQRGNGGLNLMTKVAQPLQTGGVGGTACGHHDIVETFQLIDAHDAVAGVDGDA